MPPFTSSPRVVFFDVDFTLIFPGPTFRGEGYKAFCAKHLIEVDASRFNAAVAAAAPLLDASDEPSVGEIARSAEKRCVIGRT